MNDERLWKARFHQLMLVRLAGLALFLFGIAVIYTDVLREGGWPQVGAVIVLIGALDSVLAPKLLKRLWRRP